jgi:hypothetical protein
MLFGPVWWLAHDGSLPAALALSAALAASLFMLWRVWPAFALPFVWDDAYPDTAHASWLSAVLRRSLAFARHLTREQYAEGYPLRKDFPLRGRFSRAEQTRRALSMKTEDHYSPAELEIAHLLGQSVPDPVHQGETGSGQGQFGGMGGAG